MCAEVLICSIHLICCGAEQTKMSVMHGRIDDKCNMLLQILKEVLLFHWSCLLGQSLIHTGTMVECSDSIICTLQICMHARPHEHPR